MIGNPFTRPERRRAFDQSVEALRKMFPDADDRLLFHKARAIARRVAVPKRVKVKRVPVSVAQTYRKPTRAERQADHAARMKKRRRYQYGLGYRAVANLSKRHPDYGCTPAEHARRKARRSL